MEVGYNKRNLERCLCKSCPVQMDSLCANKRKLNMLDALDNMKEDSLMPEPANIAAIYCSIGESICEDINIDEMCQCNKCPVFNENNLSTGYYCKLGKVD